MSLFGALTVAVGGLTAQSRAVANISDNLANTQTIGHKRVDTRFEAVVTQSNARVNDPGGVLATPQYTNAIRGNLVQSQISTSLAISGDGFFAVRQPEIDSTGTVTFSSQDFFSRRGDFTLNRDGFLVNGAGYYLTGYNVDTTTGDVDTSRSAPIQISQLLDNPVSTTGVDYSANLPAGATAGNTYPTSTIQIYDNLGNQHALSYTWTKNVATNQWNLNIASSTGTATVGTGSAALNHNITFGFNTSTPAGTIDSLTTTGATPFTIVTPTPPENTVDVDFTISFPGAGPQNIRLNFGRYDTASGVTQFADNDLQVASFEQNGIPRGSFRDLSIDQNGFINLNYDNGRSRTFFQVPIVQFFAPNSLQRVEGGAFQNTSDSGSPRFSAPGNVGAGTIIGNTLEGSNVDIADEFTKLIQAQRVYSANARTITTTNSMLDEVISILR